MPRGSEESGGPAPSPEFPRLPSDAAGCSARQREGNTATALADEFLAAVGAGEDRAAELALELANAVLDADDVKLAQGVLGGGALSIMRAIRLAEIVLSGATVARQRRAGAS